MEDAKSKSRYSQGSQHLEGRLTLLYPKRRYQGLSASQKFDKAKSVTWRKECLPYQWQTARPVREKRGGGPFLRSGFLKSLLWVKVRERQREGREEREKSFGVRRVEHGTNGFEMGIKSPKGPREALLTHLVGYSLLCNWDWRQSWASGFGRISNGFLVSIVTVLLWTKHISLIHYLLAQIVKCLVANCRLPNLCLMLFSFLLGTPVDLHLILVALQLKRMLLWFLSADNLQHASVLVLQRLWPMDALT